MKSRMILATVILFFTSVMPFQAASAHQLPYGRYLQSCVNCRSNGLSLSCWCRSGGNKMPTYSKLNNANTCQYIENVAGKLHCARANLYALPEGSYQEQCRHCSFDGMTLSCSCLSQIGYFIQQVELLDAGQCNRDIMYTRDGLKCLGPVMHAQVPRRLQTEQDGRPIVETQTMAAAPAPENIAIVEATPVEEKVVAQITPTVTFAGAKINATPVAVVSKTAETTQTPFTNPGLSVIAKWVIVPPSKVAEPVLAKWTRPMPAVASEKIAVVENAVVEKAVVVEKPAASTTKINAEKIIAINSATHAVVSRWTTLQKQTQPTTQQQIPNILGLKEYQLMSEWMSLLLTPNDREVFAAAKARKNAELANVQQTQPIETKMPVSRRWRAVKTHPAGQPYQYMG